MLQHNEGGSDIFWAEITPCDHIVQIYENDQVFMDALEGFIGGGLRAGDGVIVIMTPAHRAALEDRLRAQGVGIEAARAQDQFIPLDAEEILARFMRNGWPDETLFARVVTDLLTRGRASGRRVRAFGEMVAVLWGRGHTAATVRLEHLWHHLCAEHEFSLFCAYPRIGFTQNATASIEEICAAHSRVFPGPAHAH